MKRQVLLGLMILVIPLYGSAWATTDLATLGSPDVTISPTSGPPGTEITITVSHLPDISKEAYPYPELYIYLPFSQPFGVTVPSHCDGQDCFPIYTHDDSSKQNFGDRTITFSLFSKNNPNPISDNGHVNTVCDVAVNNVVMQRYSTLCNTKDEPIGTYQIKLVWSLETNLEKSFTTKTVQFTVTPGSPSSPQQVAENGNTVIREYQDGKINGTEFVSKLRTLGWNDEQIRQALAVMGKLPHQMGSMGPDNTQTVLQQMNGAKNNTEKSSSVTVENNTQQSPEPTIVQNIESTKIQNTEPTTIPSAPSINDSNQFNSPIPAQQNNSSWNFIIIGSSIAAVTVVGSVVFVFKMKR